MKPPPFAYADPETVTEVCDLLVDWGDDAALLAGGQSLVPLLNLRLARPGLVIDLGRVSGLDSITHVGGSAGSGELGRGERESGRGEGAAHVVRSGAGVGVTSLAAAHPASGVVEAIHWIGHPQIRARTTVGGTIAHADSAAELPAVLVALDGSVTLRSSTDERMVAARDWFDGPFSTTRQPTELVVAVDLPVPDGPSWWGEVARRRGDFALVGMFVSRGSDGWRVALSGVGPISVRASGCEAALDGGDLDAACVALDADLDPPEDLHAGSAHRRSIARQLLRQAVAELTPAVAA